MQLSLVMSSDITTICKETAGKTLSLESAHNFVNHEAAEVADSSRVLVTLPEDLSSVLSTHTKRLTPAYNSTRGPSVLLWLLQALHTYDIYSHG